MGMIGLVSSATMMGSPSTTGTGKREVMVTGGWVWSRVVECSAQKKVESPDWAVDSVVTFDAVALLR